jgi:hypothetical protein
MKTYFSKQKTLCFAMITGLAISLTGGTFAQTAPSGSTSKGDPIPGSPPPHFQLMWNGVWQKSGGTTDTDKSFNYCVKVSLLNRPKSGQSPLNADNNPFAVSAAAKLGYYTRGALANSGATATARINQVGANAAAEPWIWVTVDAVTRNQAIPINTSQTIGVLCESNVPGEPLALTRVFGVQGKDESMFPYYGSVIQLGSLSEASSGSDLRTLLNNPRFNVPRTEAQALRPQLLPNTPKVPAPIAPAPKQEFFKKN